MTTVGVRDGVGVASGDAAEVRLCVSARLLVWMEKEERRTVPDSVAVLQRRARSMIVV